MTPKEKAEELIRQYERHLVCPTTYGSPRGCALILVNEFIASNLLIQYLESSPDWIDNPQSLNFWMLVKNELINCKHET